jgi:sugar (pentulose or hexulose) kinase
VIEAGTAFILPELVPGSGQFPGSTSRAVQDGVEYALADIESGAKVPEFLKDERRALAALNLSLAIQTLVALDRAGLGPATSVFTEGGFRKNSGYNAILASALGGRAYLTDISEATSFGAAMTAEAALEGIDPDALGDRFDIEYKPVRPMEGLEHFERYRAAWLALVAGRGGKA